MEDCCRPRKDPASASSPPVRISSALAVFVLLLTRLSALDREDTTFKVFQFPADKIPRIDGDASDWALVPDSYAIGTDQLVDATGHHAKPDLKDLDVRIRVGWVKGLNRLYFLYEASDDYWDFSQRGLHNDIFEVIVDGDSSGGPLADRAHKELWEPSLVGAPASEPDARIPDSEAHWAIHGVHAQNYHIFTPALDKDWCMAWGSATWVKELPWSNAACSHALKPGEAGRLVLEFWLTPFDYAGPEGPQRAAESVLREGKIVGLGLAAIDYDNPDSREKDGFWILSRKPHLYGLASELCAFRLMPLEPSLRKPVEAQWSWKRVDPDRRLVAFTDRSTGPVTSWQWDFGDGETSKEQNPLHEYREARGNYVVTLEVSGPAGKARRTKVWDAQFR